MPDLSPSALNDRQKELLAKIHRALDQGDFDYVAAVGLQILQEAPDCVVVRRLAYTAHKRLRKGSPGGLARAFGGLARFSFSGRVRNPEQARARADKILARDPFNVGAWDQLAEVALALDWPETAVLASEVIREQQPDNLRNWLRLGDAWLRAGQAKEAAWVADGILKRHPLNAEAQTLLRKASIKQTTDAGAWDDAGGYREKLKDVAIADKLERAGRLQKETKPVESETRAKGADPLAVAQALVEKYPSDLDARYQLAELLLVAGDAEAAIAAYQQAQRSPKWRVRAQLGLARGFRARGLADLAVEQLRAAKQEHAARDDLFKEISYELGLSLEALGETDAAIKEYKTIYAEDIGFRDVADKIDAHYARSAED